MKKKKILFLTPSLGEGGGERVVSLLSLNFPPHIETTIAVFQNSILYPYEGRIVSLNIPTPKNIFLKIYFFILACARFKKVVREERPDAIISLGVMQNIVNPFTQKHTIVRVGNSLSKGYAGIRGLIIKRMFSILFKRTKKIIVISEGLKHDVMNLGIREEMIKVIYNPMDIEHIQQLSREEIEPRYKDIFTHDVIIAIGRIAEQKSQWHLIHAFEKMKNRENTKLVILGEGKLKQYVENLIKKLHLENDVFLLGWQKNPFAFLARSRLFVLPSRWEGLGSAILEAMACGLPVVSYDCHAGPRDILAPHTVPKQTNAIEHGSYGILVPVKNENLLKEAMEMLLGDENLYNHFKKQSLKRARDFDIKHIIKEYEALL